MMVMGLRGISQLHDGARLAVFGGGAIDDALGALALGRAIRFTVIAGLGVLYGRHIVSFFSRYYKPALYILIGLAVIGGIFALIQYLRYRNKAAGARKSPSRKAA